jgi:uridine phosphorylase
MSQVNNQDAIIFPQKGQRSPRLGPLAVLAGIETDLFRLCKLMDFDSGTYQKLFTSRLYHDHAGASAGGISITGPVVGAPYAAMVLETLIAWGAKKILFLGWCGSISEKVKIGDIIVATSAIIDEGTSGHYNEKEARLSFPSASMLTKLNKALEENQVNFHNGAIWSTDAIYRETCEKVKYFQSQDAIGVEMEISALFTVAKFRGVDLGAMAVVSDELASFKWRPGFKMDEFKHGRKTACMVIKDLCRKI